jgi:hypothetical protein
MGLDPYAAGHFYTKFKDFRNMVNGVGASTCLYPEGNALRDMALAASPFGLVTQGLLSLTPVTRLHAAHLIGSPADRFRNFHGLET